eukprot:scaffold327978_cov54-Tisochrysis_lutea.AAC.2
MSSFLWSQQASGSCGREAAMATPRPPPPLPPSNPSIPWPVLTPELLLKRVARADARTTRNSEAVSRQASSRAFTPA